jgi:alkylation response protein AidB-like acyl-CoA dehydrogenase
MLLNLSEDQQFFRDTTDRFLTEQVPPDTLRQLRHDPAGYDSAYWRRGAELGWTSLLVSEAHGGGTISDAGLVDAGLVAYEFGRHAAPGPLAVVNVVAAALSEHDAARDVLAGVLSGESVATWCAPPFGSLRWEPTVEASRSGNDLVLRGEVAIVESAGQADHLLVTCRDQGGTGVTQVLVPATTPGVTTAPMHTVDLTRRFGIVTFDEVTVPASAMVGLAGEAALQVHRQFEQLIVLLNAESVGAMQAAFDMTVEWAFDRYSFGRPLASYQALKHRFADMYMWLQSSHATSDASCAAVAAGDAGAAELVSAAKAYIGEYGAELVQDCTQMHGGIGVTFEHDLHLFLRRVTVNRALAGTPEEHHQRITAFIDAREREGAAA